MNEKDIIRAAMKARGITQALWGVAASMLGTLFGFVLWYIQSL